MTLRGRETKNLLHGELSGYFLELFFDNLYLALS